MGYPYGIYVANPLNVGSALKALEALLKALLTALIKALLKALLKALHALLKALKTLLLRLGVGDFCCEPVPATGSGFRV